MLGPIRVSAFSPIMTPWSPSLITRHRGTPTHIMALIRPLLLACLRFNIHFAARYIPARFNILADKLSRSRIPRSGTLGKRQHGHRPVQHVPSRLRQSLSLLVQASLTTSSRLHYERAWKKKLIMFHDSLCLPTQLPVYVPMVLLFIAHLHAGGSAPASVVSTISTVAYFH